MGNGISLVVSLSFLACYRQVVSRVQGCDFVAHRLWNGILWMPQFQAFTHYARLDIGINLKSRNGRYYVMYVTTVLYLLANSSQVCDFHDGCASPEGETLILSPNTVFYHHNFIIITHVVRTKCEGQVTTLRNKKVAALCDKLYQVFL